MVIRLEELAPFPIKLIEEQLQHVSAAKADVVYL